MKHIKFRILIIVWLSMILLFFAFAGILNIVLPSHFVSEAENALEYEMDYQHYISNSNDESEDDSSDYYEEDSNEESTLQKKFESGYQDSYFTSDIYYIDVTDALNDKNTSEGNSLVGSNSTSLKSNIRTTPNGLRIIIYPKNKYIHFKQITAIMYLPFMKNRRIMIIGTMQNPMKTIRLCI